MTRHRLITRKQLIKGPITTPFNQTVTKESTISYSALLTILNHYYKLFVEIQKNGVDSLHGSNLIQFNNLGKLLRQLLDKSEEQKFGKIAKSTLISGNITATSSQLDYNINNQKKYIEDSLYKILNNIQNVKSVQFEKEVNQKSSRNLEQSKKNQCIYKSRYIESKFNYQDDYIKFQINNYQSKQLEKVKLQLKQCHRQLKILEVLYSHQERCKFAQKRLKEKEDRIRFIEENYNILLRKKQRKTTVPIKSSNMVSSLVINSQPIIKLQKQLMESYSQIELLKKELQKLKNTQQQKEIMWINKQEWYENELLNKQQIASMNNRLSLQDQHYFQLLMLQANTIQNLLS